MEAKRSLDVTTSATEVADVSLRWSDSIFIWERNRPTEPAGRGRTRPGSFRYENSPYKSYGMFSICRGCPNQAIWPSSELWLGIVFLHLYDYCYCNARTHLLRVYSQTKPFRVRYPQSIAQSADQRNGIDQWSLSFRPRGSRTRGRMADLWSVSFRPRGSRTRGRLALLRPSIGISLSRLASCSVVARLFAESAALDTGLSAGRLRISHILHVLEGSDKGLILWRGCIHCRAVVDLG